MFELRFCFGLLGGFLTLCLGVLGGLLASIVCDYIRMLRRPRNTDKTKSAVPDSRLEICRLWGVSTGHLPEKDANRMSECKHLTVHEYAEGWFVWVPEEFEDYDEVLKGLQEDDFSEALGNIFSIARGDNIQWINFDSAAAIYDFLPLYHW